MRKTRSYNIKYVYNFTSEKNSTKYHNVENHLGLSDTTRAALLLQFN